jgi:hypothetical protein
MLGTQPSCASSVYDERHPVGRQIRVIPLPLGATSSPQKESRTNGNRGRRTAQWCCSVSSAARIPCSPPRFSNFFETPRTLSRNSEASRGIMEAPPYARFMFGAQFWRISFHDFSRHAKNQSKRPVTLDRHHHQGCGGCDTGRGDRFILGDGRLLIATVAGFRPGAIQLSPPFKRQATRPYAKSSASALVKTGCASDFRT